MATSKITITTGKILSSKVLDETWRRWMETQHPYLGVYLNSYKNVSRRNNLAAEFEHWLFVEGNGAVVRQHHSNRYLEFPNESAASMFILKYVC